MSHHYAGPNFGFPHGDARLNLTDLYAFPKPAAIVSRSSSSTYIRPPPLIPRRRPRRYLLRLKRCTRSRSTQMAMPWPMLRTDTLLAVHEGGADRNAAPRRRCASRRNG